MKSSTGKFHEVKVKTHGKSGKEINDPTLEGKDENTLGRIQRKTRQADTNIKK